MQVGTVAFMDCSEGGIKIKHSGTGVLLVNGWRCRFSGAYFSILNENQKINVINKLSLSDRLLKQRGNRDAIPLCFLLQLKMISAEFNAYDLPRHIQEERSYIQGT